ncbi:Serine/threonine kinase 11 [Caligus rogercresseyi]|uniref:Serine/threonine kinase 11 n=1 Tax=Caligus rogercresseyi TaxID=217165 RepID=A0A7T8JWT9_CALRO|nr:Serine/threonine kinase 11 [Caligus rogercresseyi]
MNREIRFALAHAAGRRKEERMNNPDEEEDFLFLNNGGCNMYLEEEEEEDVLRIQRIDSRDVVYEPKRKSASTWGSISWGISW